MIYLVLFACAVALGWFLSFRLGGTAEKETMCLLTCIWLGTIIANWATGKPAPVEFYAPLDFFALVWLWVHQRRNWQWIVAGFFTTMLLTHLIFWVGTHTGDIPYRGRPYQDILAGLAYLQLAATWWASHERARARDGRNSRMGHWALSTNWLFHRYSHHKRHEKPS